MSENRTRFRLNQNRAPIYEALERFRQMRVVPFDVPGHKRGRGNPELTAFLGQQCVGVDVNSMKPLDNLCHPVSVIRETEGMVCSEFVMCYPPGIPILAPGERITKEILNYIEYAKAKGCSMTGPEDPDILHLNVLA